MYQIIKDIISFIFSLRIGKRIKEKAFHRYVKRVNKFCKIHLELNPCIKYSSDCQEKIMNYLYSQLLFYYGFPQDVYIWKEGNPHIKNPFNLKQYLILENLNYLKLKRLSCVWKLSICKIRCIEGIISNFDYLVKNEYSEGHTYKNSKDFSVSIGISSISIAPSFESNKLLGLIVRLIVNPQYEKFNRKRELKKEKEEFKKFKKEIKSDKFCINICFKDVNKEPDVFKPYNIYFDKNKIERIQAFYEKNTSLTKLKKEEIQKIKLHAEWIKDVFKYSIDDKVSKLEEEWNKLRPRNLSSMPLNNEKY